MSNTTVELSEIVAFANAYNGPLFHALLCDPPYHLSSIVARYGDEDAAPAQGGVYNRSSKGFMGKQWDGGDVAFQTDTWRAISKLLYPGAFGFAFASTRGYHRMAVAIEDAGFILHPSVFAWGFGSGFPKGTRIDTQVDKAAGAERKRKKIPASAVRNQKSINGGHGVDGGDRPYIQKAQEDGYYMADAGEAVTELAKQWVDHKYGGQALKPALEPIICFQKPYPNPNKDNGMIKPWQVITQTGAGALNVGAGAIPSADPQSPPRYPPNLALVHHPSCTPKQCVTGCPVKAVQLSAEPDHARKSSRVVKQRSVKPRAVDFDFGDAPGEYAADNGGPDRYFPRLGWEMESQEVIGWFASVEAQIDGADRLRYVAKPVGKERTAGISAPKQARSTARPNSPDETGKFPDHDARKAENPHPTLKPMALTRWLASLLLPPAAYAPRRILVPFAGAGSEMIGAYAAGFEEIVGVEMTPEYAEVARQRLAYWSPKLDIELAYKPVPLVVIEPPAAPAAQLDFFAMIDARTGGIDEI